MTKNEINMHVIMLEPETLKNYENNARTHSDAQIEQIIKSIKDFGFNVPVEVNENLTILSGHARVQAALKIGMKQIPVIVQKHLTNQAKQKGYILAANKIAMNADWDFGILAEELHTLQEKTDFDLSSTGFDEKEINEMLGDMNFDPATQEEQGTLDVLEPKNVKCPHCDKQFNLRDMEK